MYRLVQAGLFGAGLVPVKTPDLIRRYNECLKEIGIAPTALPSFSVDGMGWSPEIAEEKKDPSYLSHGEATGLAIVISVNQWKKPIHFPRNSYDRSLMGQYFTLFHRIIADITLSSCLWLDMEQDIMRYELPQDLLRVHKVSVISSAGKLGEHASIQRALAKEYMKGEHAWSDVELRTKIFESVRAYGDIRTREVIVPPMVYENMRCFYSRAFGGTFVFRNQLYKKRLLIVENDQYSVPVSADTAVPVYHIHDPDIVSELFKARLIDINFALHREHPEILERAREGIVATVICENDPSVEYDSLTSPAKKRRIADLGDRVPQVYHELEVLQRYLKAGDTPKDDLSLHARLLLLHPSHLVTDAQQDLVWQLIMKLQEHPVDVLRLYTVDKMHFFDHYKTWPDSKKAWAVHLIKQHYVPKMNQ